MAYYIIPPISPSLVLHTMTNFLLLSSVLSNCHFPNFIDHTAVWYSTNAQGSHITQYIKPHIIDGKKCLSDNTGCIQYTRSCEENLGQHKFIVKHEITSQSFSNPYYMCIQFIYRSDTILQIKTSQESDIPSNSLCFDDNLVLDNWPIFATSLISAKPIQCPFSGGYNMRIRSNDRELCSDKMLSARMESECEAGDGITFDFKHPDCIHQNLKMKLTHEVDCIATWTVKNYHFVILRPNSENRFQALCLRLKEPLNNLKHAYLFMDLVCDPGNTLGQPVESTNYLSIEFERKNIHSVCEDEFEGCSDDRFCRTNMKENCKLSCGSCQSDVKLCAFPEYLRKVWSLYDGKQPARNVTISTYEIAFPDVGKFQCLFNDMTNKNRAILLHTFENGCYPKFTCMETYFSSDSVRQFRLGNRLNWPMFPLDKVQTHACRSTMFRTQINVGDSSEYITTPKITVVDPSYTKSVNCRLSYEFHDHMNGLYFKEGNKCDGCVYYDSNLSPQTFEIRTIECPNASNFVEYICLASFKFDNETSAVVTGTRVGYNERITQFLCWIFTGSGRKRKIVVFHAADCNEIQLKLALAEEVKPLSMFDIIEKAPKNCPLPVGDKPVISPPKIPIIAVSEPTKKPTPPKYIIPDNKQFTPKEAEKMNIQSDNNNSANGLFLHMLTIIICLLISR